MGGIVGAVIGLLVATFGFLVMRNPMRLALLAPGQEGYDQRLVLDTSSRNGLRMLERWFCVVGAVIMTAALGGVLKLNFLKSASDRLLILRWLIFAGAFVSGLVQTVKQTIKGEQGYLLRNDGGLAAHASYQRSQRRLRSGLAAHCKTVIPRSGRLLPSRP